VQELHGRSRDPQTVPVFWRHQAAHAFTMSSGNTPRALSMDPAYPPNPVLFFPPQEQQAAIGHSPGTLTGDLKCTPDLCLTLLPARLTPPHVLVAAHLLVHVFCRLRLRLRL
jgi:hypothetical protein